MSLEQQRPELGTIPILYPYHWWQHPTRLSIAIRLGITRILLERQA